MNGSLIFYLYRDFFVVSERIVCREVLDEHDPELDIARQLYESTQAKDEQIPWEWLARSVARRREREPGQRRSHLLLTSPPVGFAYGVHLPGYGGYVSYLGVDSAARGKGAGSALFEDMFHHMAEDAHLGSEALPFIIWESRRPLLGASEAMWRLWSARLALFRRIGGLWIDGVDFLSPNYTDPTAPPLKLQLFLRPWDEPARAFDAERLRAVVQGLHEEIYRLKPSDPLAERTLPATREPRLRPAAEAEQIPESMI